MDLSVTQESKILPNIDDKLLSFRYLFRCPDDDAFPVSVPLVIAVRLVVEPVHYIVVLTVSHGHHIALVRLNFEHHLTYVLRI